jgi:hypothetical protein
MLQSMMAKKDDNLETLLQQLPAAELDRHVQILRALAERLSPDLKNAINRFAVPLIDRAAKAAKTLNVEMPAQAPVDRTKWPSLDEIQWPTEKYTGSDEHKLSKRRKGEGGIVPFLERVWYPNILKPYPGLVTLKMLRDIDFSAATGVSNYKRGGVEFPSHLTFPIKKEVTDKLEKDTDSESLRQARRLISALESRQRRARTKAEPI